VDNFFTDSSEVRLPPDQVRIRQVRVEPLPDGRRLRVYLEVDPFQKRPSTELVIFDAAGQQVASAHVIESMWNKMEIVMHLRNPGTSGRYLLSVHLLYSTFHDEVEPSQEWKPVEHIVVDTAQVEFEVTEPGEQRLAQPGDQVDEN
jgi:hypothetical protein